MYVIYGRDYQRLVMSDGINTGQNEIRAKRKEKIIRARTHKWLRLNREMASL